MSTDGRWDLTQHLKG